MIDLLTDCQRSIFCCNPTQFLMSLFQFLVSFWKVPLLVTFLNGTIFVVMIRIHRPSGSFHCSQDQSLLSFHMLNWISSFCQIFKSHFGVGSVGDCLRSDITSNISFSIVMSWCAVFSSFWDCFSFNCYMYIDAKPSANLFTDQWSKTRSVGIRNNSFWHLIHRMSIL